MLIEDEHHLLSSRAAGPADGAPNDWRRALRLRSGRSDGHRKDQDVFTKTNEGIPFYQLLNDCP